MKRRAPDPEPPNVYDGAITLEPWPALNLWIATVLPATLTGHAADRWATASRECPLDAIHCALCNALAALRTSLEKPHA